LHVGHAKSICLNFGLAKEYEGGVCHMRFDDTNPVKEDLEYVRSILADVKWLMSSASAAAAAAGAASGAESSYGEVVPWNGDVKHTSDYFELLYEAAVFLIREGKAYIDFLSPEDMRLYRGTLTEPGKPSPDRLLMESGQRTTEEALELSEQMKAGKFEEGQALVPRSTCRAQT